MKDPMVSIGNDQGKILEISLWSLFYMLIYEQKIIVATDFKLYLNDEEVDKPEHHEEEGLPEEGEQ